MKALLATDGSEPALRACSDLVALLTPGRDEVRVLTVLSYSLYPYSQVPDTHLVDERQRERHAREEVDRLTGESVRLLEESGLRAEAAHRFGNPGEEILAEIREWRPDLVALGRRNVHGLDRLLGSVSEHVLHHADVPVLLVR